MARKPRIHYPGAVYHVMLRGNNGQQIFYTEENYYQFEKLLEEGITSFGHRVHGFCWMPNHVHLVLEVQETGLPKIIQNISFRYTRKINKEKGRIGHLFQEKIKGHNIYLKK